MRMSRFAEIQFLVESKSRKLVDQNMIINIAAKLSILELILRTSAAVFIVMFVILLAVQ